VAAGSEAAWASTVVGASSEAAAIRAAPKVARRDRVMDIFTPEMRLGWAPARSETGLGKLLDGSIN
jgi:hypothetical protein